LPVRLQQKKRCFPSGDTMPRPGERTSSMAWMRRLTAGSRGGGAYFFMVSGVRLAAPWPLYGVWAETADATRRAARTTGRRGGDRIVPPGRETASVGPAYNRSLRGRRAAAADAPFPPPLSPTLARRHAQTP